MKRGRLAATPSTKLANGTFYKSRDGNKIEMKPEMTNTENSILLPNWLTSLGREVWLDNINYCTPVLTDADVNCFAIYCNLMGLIQQYYMEGKRPSFDYLSEARKLSELFGLCGAKSRVIDDSAGSSSANPFNKSRRGYDGWSSHGSAS